MSTIRNVHRERWTTIDRRLINDASLSFRAKGIMLWLLDKPDGWNFDSVKLAASAKEGRDAVRSAVKELETAGYIVRLRVRDDAGQWVTITELHEAPGRTSDWESGAGFPTLGFPGAKESTETKTEELHAQPLVERADLDPEFESFWALYPRRVGKATARRAFIKLWKRTKPQGELYEPMMAGLRARAAWWAQMETPQDKMPHAATWLNGERWLDEIEAVARPSVAPSPIPDEVRQWCVRRDGEWWSMHADEVEKRWKLAVGQGYQPGELAVRLAIQYRVDRNELARGNNFVLMRVPNVGRFRGGLPTYFGAPATYAELMDLAATNGKWLVRS